MTDFVDSESGYSLVGLVLVLVILGETDLLSKVLMTDVGESFDDLLLIEKEFLDLIY